MTCLILAKHWMPDLVPWLGGQTLIPPTTEHDQQSMAMNLFS